MAIEDEDDVDVKELSEPHTLFRPGMRVKAVENGVDANMQPVQRVVTGTVFRVWPMTITIQLDDHNKPYRSYDIERVTPLGESLEDEDDFDLKDLTAPAPGGYPKGRDKLAIDDFYSAVSAELFGTTDTGALSQEQYNQLKHEVNQRRLQGESIEDEDDFDMKDLVSDLDWINPGAEAIIHFEGKQPERVRIERMLANKSYCVVKDEQGRGAIVASLFLRPIVKEALEDDEDDDIDARELDTGFYQSRKEWADAMLLWDKEANMYEIRDCAYDMDEPGTVAHVNHTVMLLRYPWLKEGGPPRLSGLYLSPEDLESMPLYNQFKRDVNEVLSGNPLDYEMLDDLQNEAVATEWKKTYAGEFSDALTRKLGPESKSPHPEQDIRDFLHGPNGLRYFNHLLDLADSDWDTQQMGHPTVDIEAALEVATWPELQKVVYPDKNQLQFPFREEDRFGQRDLFGEAVEDEDDFDMKDLDMLPPRRFRLVDGHSSGIDHAPISNAIYQGGKIEYQNDYRGQWFDVASIEMDGRVYAGKGRLRRWEKEVLKRHADPTVAYHYRGETHVSPVYITISAADGSPYDGHYTVVPDIDVNEAVEDEDDFDFKELAQPEFDADAVKAWCEEELVFDAYAKAWILADYSDFSGTVADRANGEWWVRNFQPRGMVCRQKASMGRECVGIREMNIPRIDMESLQEMQDAWAGLQNDPVIDSRIYAEAEQELRQDAWRNWIKRQVRQVLNQKYPQWEEAIDDFMEEDQAYAMFEDARQQSGYEWHEGEGGEQGIHLDNVVDFMTPELVSQWLFHGQQPPQTELPIEEALLQEGKFSCVMAPAPPALFEAVITWGDMFVTDDEIYDDDKHDFGREREPHVTVKFGLHDAQPSQELMDIIEQTQPFEIEVGVASLFEAEQYDVLKFDVEGEALRELNARIGSLPCTDTHPEYHPHITISYIQKGTCRELLGKPLVDMAENQALRFIVKHVVFSALGGGHKKTTLFLGKPNMP